MLAVPWVRVRWRLLVREQGCRVHLCAHIEILLTNTCAHGHTDLHTSCMHMSTQGFGWPCQVPFMQGMGPEPHQGLTAPEGHVPAQPLPGWGLVAPPSISLAIATNLDQALGHTMLRNPAGQPVPAIGKDLVPSEISPRAKPVPKQVPRVPVTLWFPRCFPWGGTQCPMCHH